MVDNEALLNSGVKRIVVSPPRNSMSVEERPAQEVHDPVLVGRGALLLGFGVYPAEFFEFQAHERARHRSSAA
jgi:hypothetical protein